MAVAEQAMNRTPTAIAFPLYGFIVSRLSSLRADSRNSAFAFASSPGLCALPTADCCCITLLPASVLPQRNHATLGSPISPTQGSSKPALQVSATRLVTERTNGLWRDSRDDANPR